ncbi:ABC transporter permease [Dehalococcoidia bacterium]|nr:ABC transporter permease [Dehalococcoidia bacterium]
MMASLLQHRIDPQNVSFILVGAGMVGMWTRMLGGSTNALWNERMMGTLQVLLASPTPLQTIVAGGLFAQVLMGLTAFLVAYMGAFTTIPLPLITPNFPALALSIITAVVGMLAIALPLGAIMSLSESMIQWFDGLIYPVVILGGFLFPIILLPPWTTPLSYALTPYWVALLLREAVSGAEISAIWPICGVVLLLSLGYAAVSRWLFRRVLYRLRMTGSVSL